MTGVGITNDLCQTKWRSLKDRFLKEVNKKQKSGSEAPDDGSLWKYFEAMSFLKENVASEERLRTLVGTPKNESIILHKKKMYIFHLVRYQIAFLKGCLMNRPWRHQPPQLRQAQNAKKHKTLVIGFGWCGPGHIKKQRECPRKEPQFQLSPKSLMRIY